MIMLMTFARPISKQYFAYATVSTFILLNFTMKFFKRTIVQLIFHVIFVLFTFGYNILFLVNYERRHDTQKNTSLSGIVFRNDVVLWLWKPPKTIPNKIQSYRSSFCCFSNILKFIFFFVFGNDNLLLFFISGWQTLIFILFTRFRFVSFRSAFNFYCINEKCAHKYKNEKTKKPKTREKKFNET